jgi:hypothetical protein
MSNYGDELTPLGRSLLHKNVQIVKCDRNLMQLINKLQTVHCIVVLLKEASPDKIIHRFWRAENDSDA